jgi:hypothetical protein
VKGEFIRTQQLQLSTVLRQGKTLNCHACPAPPFRLKPDSFLLERRPRSMA